MHRLFVAVQPPADIRRLLLAAMGGVARARWQADEQLHLTLRFIGEVDRHSGRDVMAALGAVHHPRFTIALDGVGQFDRRGRIDTLWAAVQPHAPLKTLHNKIDQALGRVGIAPEGRAYLPHITLARFGRDAGAIAGFMADNGGLVSAPFAVEDFCLYESRLSQDGAIYTVLERYPLG
jgi:2'-5' RNA ligase